MRPWIPLVLLTLAVPASAQREDELLAHWRLATPHFSGGSFRPLYGQPPLRPSGKPSFMGEGDSQALVVPQDWGLLTSAGRVPSDVLPRKRMTLEAWVAVDKVGEWGGFLGAIEDNGDHERGWLLGYRRDRFCFGVANEGLGRLHYLTAPDPYRTGRWYHVAGTYDGEVQRLYVDGQLVAEFEDGGGNVLYDRDHLLAAGAYKDSNEQYPMVGGLYEVRLWNRALSQSDLERRFKKMADLMPAPTEGNTVSGFALPKPPSVLELQPAINGAIDRGVAWLLARQHRDGSWESHQDAYRNGATALALYTLLKQGLPASHPAVQNALAYLRSAPPSKTYSAGCLLLALAALGDRDNQEWAQEIVDLLVDWESGGQPGGYGYPGGAVDLSNTQYAALGFWAAAQLGVDAPKDLWVRMVLNACELHQRNVQELEWEGPDADERTGKRRIAGFSYRANGGNDTGSMTAAGLCVLGTARAVFGDKLGRKAARPAAQAERMSLEWLAENWSVDRSPGGGQHLYYLYGLERVGALYQTEVFGEHEWYRDGAEKLIKMQRGGGEWGGEPDTCFALLFLSRATARSTGPGVSHKAKGWETRAGDVWLYATGDDTLAMWITGFKEGVLDRRKGLDADRVGLRVVRVEYLVDGAVIATVDGDPRKPWRGDRFPSRHTFATFGKHTLRARVHVVPAGESPEAYGAPQVLDSGPLDVQVMLSPEAFQRRHLVDPEAEDKPLDAPISHLEASSIAHDNHKPERVSDGRQATRWVCNKDDAFPWLRMELREPIKVRGIRLSPAASALHLVNHFEPISKVRILVNGEDEHVLRFQPDGLTWATLTFEREERVRSLEIRVEDRQAVGAKSVGLAEVVLLGEPPRKRRRGR